jgi:hypothetical protein
MNWAIGNPWPSGTATYSNFPLPVVPEADLSQQVARHLGMHCICYLLDCCHNEMPGDNYAFRHHSSGHHMDSGSPASGYLYPWEPGDESWRDSLTDLSAVTAAKR